MGRQWKAFVPFDYSGTSLLAFSIGGTFWWPLNKLKRFDRDEQALKTIDDGNDFLEMMLAQAQRDLRLVSVVLKSRKVYVGFVTAGFDPVNDRDYIQLLPLQSGYRDSKTLQLKITTDYSQVYDRIVTKTIEPATFDRDDFRVVIPVSEITSTSFFDEEAYPLFNPVSEGSVEK